MNGRRQRVLAAAAAGALIGGFAGEAHPAGAMQAPRAALSGFDCHRALAPVDRSMSVVAVMRPLPGATALQVSFRLLERVPGEGAATVVRGTGLDTWITPTDPTLGRRPGDVWRVDKQVSNLQAPAGYRLIVRFRWRGHGGRIVRTETRASRGCWQP